MKKGIELITEERARQIAVEGWSPEHDDRHDEQQLSLAASSYEMNALHPGRFKVIPPQQWPWQRRWWKPSKPVRDLTKAGALYLAEAERLERLNFPEAKSVILTMRNSADRCAHQIDSFQSK